MSRYANDPRVQSEPDGRNGKPTYWVRDGDTLHLVEYFLGWSAFSSPDLRLTAARFRTANEAIYELIGVPGE